MTKSQKRNARRRRAQARALSPNQIGLTVTYYFVRPHGGCIGKDHVCPGGLLRLAECAVPNHNGIYVSRMAEWNWDSTSHETVSGIPAELREVLTYVCTQDFAACPKGSAECRAFFNGQEGSQRWQIVGTEDVETVVADVIAAISMQGPSPSLATS